MKISKDTIELLQSWTKMIISLFMIVMGCLLAVFVPQYCPETSSTCTIKQQFTDLTRYNEFVLGWNFLTLALVLAMRVSLLLRERYLIRHFDEDRTKPDTDFENILKLFPTIDVGLYHENRRALIANIVAMFMVFTNVVVSTVLIIQYWDDYRSGTVLATNGVLILQLVWTTLSILLSRDTRTCSCMRMEPVLHNVVDGEWLKDNSMWARAAQSVL
jgi:cytochrome c biogenesis protein CcdA